ncbi:MAG: phosphodiester glycosidase family protein, partial [Clostridia bacterium]|nr:phosphodiester glycosidase family protein [Clostridia bacterium]
DESLIAAQAAVGDFSAKFADKFTDGEVIATDTTYQSANVNITLSRITGKIGDYEQVCFVEDIYIRNIDCLRTVLAKDKFGRSLTEDALSMSRRANALCAINADFYSFGNAGIVIRNGVLYRDRYQTDEEVLVIFRNGSMEVFSKASQMDMEALMARGAWQAFSFGPSLLNEQGELRARYKSVNHDPRTIIGMVEPGHYLFIVVDGRQNGYSEGLTYYESALLAQRLGCTVAFNLDGGKTTQMLFDDRVVNKPYKGGRDTSDLICIADISR